MKDSLREAGIGGAVIGLLFALVLFLIGSTPWVMLIALVIL